MEQKGVSGILNIDYDKFEKAPNFSVSLLTNILLGHHIVIICVQLSLLEFCFLGNFLHRYHNYTKIVLSKLYVYILPLKGKSASFRKCCFLNFELSISNLVIFLFDKTVVKVLFSKFDFCFYGFTTYLPNLSNTSLDL